MAELETGLCRSKSVELETELYHSERVGRESMLCIERVGRVKALCCNGTAAKEKRLGIEKGEQEKAL